MDTRTLGFLQPADYMARGKKSGMMTDTYKHSTKRAEAKGCYEFQDRRATNLVQSQHGVKVPMTVPLPPHTNRVRKGENTIAFHYEI